MLFSKLLRQSPALLRRMPLVPGRPMPVLAPTRRLSPMIQAPARSMFGLVPKSQYDIPLSNKFVISYALCHYWETIPLFLVCAFDVVFVVMASCFLCVFNKVDIQWSKHNWNCISRNMDLRNPTVHKNLTYFQTYEPWPEMQLVLDKMTEAEHRLLTRMASCSRP